MSLRYITTFSLLFSSLLAGQTALLHKAKALLEQPSGRQEAEALLTEAAHQYEKQGSKTDEAAEAMVLLGMVRNPALAKNKEALESQVEPLARKALEIRRNNPDTKAADLALTLEFDALVLEELGRIDDSRDPKAKAREIRDQIMAAMQPPQDDLASPVHIGGAVKPPMLMARSEPHLTFYARVLMLQPEVMAELVIGADGNITHVEMFKPAGFGLDESALQALMQWRFKPAQKGGMPVAVEGNLKLRFQP
jgi:TonB family protein